MWGFSFTEKGQFIFKEKERMIYLNNTSTPQMVSSPKSRETEGRLVFSVKSTINLSVPVDARVAQLESDLYIQFPVALPADADIGEYEYTLTDNAGILSTGILVVEGKSDVKEYNLSVQYEQYE